MRAKPVIILVGGGGHSKACIEIIEQENHFRIAGIVDQPQKVGQKVLGYPVVASDAKLSALVKKHKNFLVTVGQIKSAAKRVELFERLKSLKANLPTIVSPLAHVSRHAVIGEGTIIMHGAFINAGAKIGRSCIINTGAIIEHDAVVEDHCHISTGSIVNGECRVAQRSFLGSNSVLANNVRIAAATIIGAGAVVTKDIGESGVFVGVPARNKRQTVLAREL